MKPRTCPKCNHKYSIKEYFTQLSFKFIWSSWECPNCHSNIKFNVKRRILIAILQAIWLLGFFLVKDHFEVDFIRGLFLVILLLFGMFVLFTFDIFIVKRTR